MPIINLTLPHGGSVAFEYTGEYITRRTAEGRKIVRLTSSGEFTWLGAEIDVEVFMLAGGGGGGAVGNLQYNSRPYDGGGGGWRFLSTRLTPGVYDIIVGEGGRSSSLTAINAGPRAGGDTVAFGCRCTGGQPPAKSNVGDNYLHGQGGQPNGQRKVPNGGYAYWPEGDYTTGSPVYEPGGPGYVELMF